MSGYLDSHLSLNSQETAFLVTLENPNDKYFEDATDDFDSIIGPNHDVITNPLLSSGQDTFEASSTIPLTSSIADIESTNDLSMSSCGAIHDGKE